MPFVFEQEIEQPKERFVFEDPEPAFEDPRLYGIPEGAGEPISTITGKPLLTDFGKPKKADVPSGRFVFEEPEEADFIERVKSSWKTGVAQTELGQLRYRQLLGEDTDEINQQIADLKIGMPSPDKIKRGLPERAIKAAAEMLPIQVAGMKKGAKRGLKMGLGFAGVTAIAGQAGPQVALPEEIVTVPAAFAGGYGVGMLSGTLENIGQIEAGLAYDELLDFKDDKGNRVDPVIAKAAAASVGVINGLIEMAQIKLLLKTIPGGEALLRGSINKTLKKAVTSKTLKAIALKHAGRYGTFIAGETGQEVLQESTNILANEIAKDVTNELRGTDLPATTIQEIGNRLVDTAKQSALAFSVMGIPGTVVSGGIEAGKRKATEPTIPTTPETDQQTTLTNIKAALESGEITTDDVANYARSPEAQEDGIADDLNALIAEAKEIAKPPDVAPSAKDILTEGEDVTAKELLTGKALTDEERIEERAKILEEAPKKPAEISAEAFERKITEEERVKAKAEIEPDLNKFFKRAKEIPITPKQKDLLRGLTKEQAQKIAVQWNEIWKAGTETAKQARITEAETFVRERPDLFNLVHGLLMVKPTPAEPKTDVAFEPVGVEIPDFKTTGEAYAFGEKATPEQVKELQRLVKVQDTKFNELKKAGKLQEAMDEAIKHQFYNEALQKVEGTEQYKKFKPEPKEVPKTGTETEKVEVTPEKKEAWEMTPKEWTQESLQPTIEKMKIGETKVLPDKRIIVKSSQDLTYGETYISRSPVKTKMLDPSEIDQLPDKIKNFVERYEAGEKDLPPIYVSELMVNPKTGETFREIRDGHHRYYMAEEVGLEELPAMERVSGLYPEEHEAIVRNALKKGENVPENVLAEYPDLKPQPPKIEKPKPKLPRTEDLEGEGIPEVALKTWKSEFAETYKKSEFSEPERWDEFKAFSKKEYAEGFPISEHFEGWMAKSKPKPKKEKVEVTKEDIEAFIKPLHHKYYLEGQNKGIAVEKLNAYGALQINKLVGSKLRANVDMDAVKQYLKEHPTKVEVTKKAGVEITLEKKEPWQMGENEYVQSRLEDLKGKIKLTGQARNLYLIEWQDKFTVTHQRSVEKAIQEGKLPKPKKEKVEVAPEKPKPFNIVQATKKILPDDSDVHLDGEQLSIYPSAVVNSKAINTKISKILTDRQLHASIKSVKIFNPEISEVAEKEKVETKTTPEGKEISVDLTKKEEAAVTPKQQKEYLLAEIDKAIEAELKTEGFGKGIEDAKELLKRRINPLIQSKTTYKFEVPNDGTFEIAGSALFEFQDRVKSTFPSTITSKKFKPKVKARKGVPTAKYNKILGKAAKDLKPADIDRIFKEVADTEARDITGAVLLNPFQNWLLSQDITKAVKDKIRSVAGKDYIEEARVKIETQDIEYARSMVEHTRNEYDYLRSYHSEYKTGEKTLKQIAKETGIKRSGNELAEEASEAKSAYYKAAEHLEKLEKPTGIKEPTRVRDEKAFATKATKPQDTITRKDLRKIFKRMKHIRTGQDSDGNLWFKAEGRPKITIFELDNITGHLNTSAGQIPVGSYLRDTIELKTGGEGHTADISTAYHELHHWLEKQQLLSANDITALNRVIAKDKGISASAVTEEHRAYYVGDNISAWETQKHPRIRRILRKLTDFMNAIYDFAAQAGWVKGRERTAENVLSDIESGRILSEKELAGVNQFAQDVAFSLKKATKKITDNPNFIKWFGLSPDITRNNIVDDLIGKTSIGTETEFAKSVVNSIEANIGNITYFRQSRSLADKIFNNLDIPRKRMVLSTMGRMINAKPEIINSVVKLIPVDMMNNLEGKKLSPDVFLHDKAMLQDLFSVDKDGSISLGSDIAPSFVRAVAFAITESSPSDMGFWSNDLRSTMGAGSYDSIFSTISTAKKSLGCFYPISMDFKRDTAPRALYSNHNSSFDKIDLTIYKDNKKVKLKSKDIEKKINKTKSKVVDGKGEPLVVYHGTVSKEPFSVFDIQYTDFGAHFTPSTELASVFARTRHMQDFEHPRIYPAYLSIQNYIRLKDQGSWGAVDILSQIRDKNIITQQEYDTISKELTDVYHATPKFGALNKIIHDLLRSKGYDGVIYLNRREARNGKHLADVVKNRLGVRFNIAIERIDISSDNELRSLIGKEATDSYIAFESTQIKSIFNTGAFGLKEPDIRYSMAGKKAIGAPTGQLVKAQEMLSHIATSKPTPLETILNRIFAGSKFSFNIPKSHPTMKEGDSGIDIKAKPLGGRAIIGDASTFEISGDSATINVKSFGDLSKVQAFVKHGFDFMDIESKRVVIANMISASRELKVRKAIVESIPVGMMNNLRRQKLSPDMLLHDQSMLQSLFAINLKSSIPIGMDIARSIIVSETPSIAKISLVDFRRYSVKDSPATVAKDFQHDIPSHKVSVTIPASEEGVKSKVIAGKTMPYESQGIPEDQWIITKGKGTSFSVQEQKAFSVKGGKDYSAMFEKYRVKRTTPLVDELIKKTQADFDPVNATPEETKAFFKDIRLIPKRFRSEVMSVKDMKWYHKALETPYVLAKKFISMEKALRTEIRRHESRTKKVFGYYHGDLGDLQKHMQKNPEDLKTFEALIWEWEGHRFSEKEVPTDWYSVIEDVKDDDYGGIRINPEHYTEVRKYLKKQGVKDVIADGFISVRKLLDNVLIEADSTMRSNNIDQSDLKEFRSYIGKAHNYFSHVREGNSYIKITNRNTKKTVYREHFWAGKERLLPKDKMAKARTETWLNDQIELGKLSGEKSDYIISPARRVTKLPDEVFFQIPVEALSQISTEAGRGLAASRVRYEALRLMKKEGLSEKEAHEKADKTLTADIERHLARAMADVLKTRGWGQHAIQRQNIPGFKKTDTFETLSGYLTGYAGFATKIQAAKEHSKTLRDMDAKKTPAAYKYTSDYIRDMLANADKTDQMVDRLRAMFFVKYLGGVVKSGMVNLTQNVVMAGPVLSQYTKFSHTKLARAMKDTRKGITGKNAWMGKETSYTTLPENEQKALIEGIETGAAQDLYLRELKGDIPGKGWGRYAKKVIDKAGIFMMVAEKFNRASTLLAAYRIAFNEGTLYDGKQTKKNHDLSVRFAKKAVYDSHFLYGKPNLPAGFRGGDFRKVARAAYTFRSFTHNYLDIMVDLMANQGTQGFKVAGRSLMNLLVVGGLTSIPFFKALSEIIQWAQDDEDEDMLTEIRSKMPNKFMQDMVVYGLSGAVGGFDLSGSLSIEIPTKMKEIIGVPYSMYEDSMRTVASVKAGNMYRAVSETPFTPIAMRNAMRGIELYTKGQRTRGGKAINVPGKREPRKITGVEAVKKAALGLQPVEVSSGYKAYRAATKMKRAIADKKRDWADRIANATIKRDLKKVREIKAEIQEWNLAARRDKKLWRLIDINKMVENRLQGKGLRAFPAKMRKEAQARYEVWQ